MMVVIGQYLLMFKAVYGSENREEKLATVGKLLNSQWSYTESSQEKEGVHSMIGMTVFA